MKKIGGLFFLVLALSGFALAGSSSEINMTLIVSDPAVASVVGSSASLSFWGIYGDYVVVGLILVVVGLLLVKVFSKKKRVSRRKKKKK